MHSDDESKKKAPPAGTQQAGRKAAEAATEEDKDLEKLRALVKRITLLIERGQRL